MSDSTRLLFRPKEPKSFEFLSEPSAAQISDELQPPCCPAEQQMHQRKPSADTVLTSNPTVCPNVFLLHRRCNLNFRYQSVCVRAYLFMCLQRFTEHLRTKPAERGQRRTAAGSGSAWQEMNQAHNQLPVSKVASICSSALCTIAFCSTKFTQRVTQQ